MISGNKMMISGKTKNLKLIKKCVFDVIDFSNKITKTKISDENVYYFTDFYVLKIANFG